MILLYGLKLHLLLLFLCEFFVENLSGWYSGLFKQHFRFEPTVGDLQLSLDLFPNEVKLVNCFAELATNCLVVVLRELLAFILAEVEAVERVFQGEAMSDLELFPCDYTTCADLIWFYLEAAVSVIKQMGLLSIYTG